MSWRAFLFVLLGLSCSAASAQSALSYSDCHRDSVVLTRCTDDAPTHGIPSTTPGSQAQKDAQKDEQQKKEARDDLERQRAKGSAAASADPNELERAEVLGHRERTKTPDEVFDSYFGTSTGSTSRSTDSMGNMTECVKQCTGPGCCRTVLANPPSPGLVNHEP